MTRSAPQIDDRLPSWGDVRRKAEWSGILLGNGSSIAVWDDFRYTSLYAVARSNRIANPLSKEDAALFAALKTRNFERVLTGLRTTRVVLGALGKKSPELRRRYASIRRGLRQAIRAVHVPWSLVQISILPRIRSALLPYGSVYSTNYDLLVYWAIMSEQEGEGFKDYFWSEMFDVTDTEIFSKATTVLYLHGGLHLYRLPSGETLKRRRQPWSNLLDLSGTAYGGSAVPLFITEGTAKDKLGAIYRSDYLAFAYSQFTEHAGPLVVFGRSLSNADRHLLTPMREWKDRLVAISVLAGPSAKVIAAKARYHQALPEAKLLFFEASSHPLGRAELRVSP